MVLRCLKSDLEFAIFLSRDCDSGVLKYEHRKSENDPKRTGAQHMWLRAAV